MTTRRLSLITFTTAALLAAGTASAAIDATWQLTGGGNWATAANWSTNPDIPENAEDTATFNLSNSGSQQSIQLNGARTIGELHFLTGVRSAAQDPLGFIQTGTGGSLTFDNGDANAVINVASGTHGTDVNFTLASTDTIEKTGVGSFRLAGNRTNTAGAWIIKGGTAQADSANSFGNASSTNTVTVESGATVRLFGGNKTMTNAMTLTGAGAAQPDGVSTGALLLQMNSGAATTYNGIITLGGNATIRNNTAGTGFHVLGGTTGYLTGNGNLTIDNTDAVAATSNGGRWFFRGTGNTYSGALMVNSGWLFLDRTSGSNNLVTGDLNLAGNAFLSLGAGSSAKSEQIANSATVTMSGTSNFKLGSETSGSATETITGLVLNDNATLEFQANDVSRLILGTGTPTTRGLHLTTGGSLIVNNTFDPAYNVNGVAADASRVLTVVSGATLGGSGTIGSTNFGSVVINGKIAPGNSAGTLNLNVPLTVNGTYEYEAGDLLNILGSLTLGGSSVLDLVGSLDPSQNYTIATYTNGLTGTFSDVDSSITATHFLVYGPETGSGSVMLMAIPEPGSVALIALGGLMIGVRRRTA
jgi:fibronectin-binding autotransporter adhesin